MTVVQLNDHISVGIDQDGVITDVLKYGESYTIDIIG